MLVTKSLTEALAYNLEFLISHVESHEKKNVMFL